MSLREALFSTETTLGLELARVCLGLTLAAEFLSILTHKIYSDEDGLLNREAFLALPNRRSSLFALDFFAGRSRWLLLLGLVSALSVAAGFLTKPSTVCCFVIVSSMTVRYQRILHAGVTFASLLLFFLIFSPAGTAYSVDRALGIALHLDVGWSWAVLCAKAQVTLLYLGAVVSKLKHPEWRDGTLTYRLLSHGNARTRVPMPPFVASWPVSRAATYGVILVELICPLTLWWRGLPSILSTAALLLLHLSMSVFLRVRLFPFYVLAGLALFVSSK